MRACIPHSVLNPTLSINQSINQPTTHQARLRFLRRQHQALRAQNADAQRAFRAAKLEREELSESAEACVRRVEEEHARRGRELEGRIRALERELAVKGGGRGSGGGVNGHANADGDEVVVLSGPMATAAS
jgi:hypothetical protein